MSDPRITDDVTFHALRGFDKRPGYSKLDRMRDALEVAAPLLAPQPVVDREALGLVLDAHQLISDNGSEVGCSCGWTSTDSWRHGEHREHQMDAILALLNGTTK